MSAVAGSCQIVPVETTRDDESKGDKSESERWERAGRKRIDEGCDGGEGAVGRPLGDSEASSILSAAEAGDGDKVFI